MSLSNNFWKHAFWNPFLILCISFNSHYLTYNIHKNIELWKSIETDIVYNSSMGYKTCYIKKDPDKQK